MKEICQQDSLVLNYMKLMCKISIIYSLITQSALYNIPHPPIHSSSLLFLFSLSAFYSIHATMDGLEKNLGLAGVARDLTTNILIS